MKTSMWTHLAVGAFAFSLATACDIKNPKTTKLQYMPDMADSPTVKAQEGFINPPEHAISVNAILYPASFEIAEEEFRNPYPKSDQALAHGKELFNTFCSVCHGPDGKGQGSLGTSYPIGVPDITRQEMVEKKDGFFFMKISQGGAIMPSYGHATSANDRWQIIHYVRMLQGG